MFCNIGTENFIRYIRFSDITETDYPSSTVIIGDCNRERPCVRIMLRDRLRRCLCAANRVQDEIRLRSKIHRRRELVGGYLPSPTSVCGPPQTKFNLHKWNFIQEVVLIKFCSSTTTTNSIRESIHVPIHEMNTILFSQWNGEMKSYGIIRRVPGP